LQVGTRLPQWVHSFKTDVRLCPEAARLLQAKKIKGNKAGEILEHISGLQKSRILIDLWDLAMPCG